MLLPDTFSCSGKLTGTLANPKLAVNVQGTAVAGLRIGAAIATAGISLLAESAARKAMPAHPCQAALAASTDTGSPANPPSDPSAGTPEKKSGFLDRLRGK